MVESELWTMKRDNWKRWNGGVVKDFTVVLLKAGIYTFIQSGNHELILTEEHHRGIYINFFCGKGRGWLYIDFILQ